MSNYVVEEIKRVDLGNKKEGVKRLQRKDGKKLTAEEVRDLYFSILQKLKDDKKKNIYILARCRTGTGMFSFMEPVDILDDAEYWDGKVRDNSKFTSFYYVDFHIVFDK